MGVDCVTGKRGLQMGTAGEEKRREISLCAGRPFAGAKGKKKSPCSVRNDGVVWAAGAKSYGVMAITRRGLPEPFTIFRGAAMTTAPVGGN